MRTPKPSHREAIALFRLSVIGDLLARDLERGELKQELLERAAKRYRPPGAASTRTFHHKTLESWYYKAKRGHSAALEPVARTRGFGLALTLDQRKILLAMRREHRSVAADLILREAERHGVVEHNQISLPTLRRMFREAGLSRQSRRRQDRADAKQRRRWQAARPGDLWHGDVCHVVLGRGRKALVHGLMDDNSRYFVALSALHQEREQDMLRVFLGALLRNPPPRAMYLDNGSCYRGDLLALVCKRLDIRLIHAAAYDAPARGKMERVWRTLRQRCTDLLKSGASLHDVGVALWSWLDADYHCRPHAALLGASPRRRFLDGGRDQRPPLTPEVLARALEVTETRQVRKDGTFAVAGRTYEVAGAWLAGKRINVVIDGLKNTPLRVSLRGDQIRFGPCDAVANGRRRRPASPPPAEASTTPFDPIAGLLERARKELPCD